MLRSLAAAAFAAGLLVHGAGALHAQGDVVSQRQALMKEAGAATRTASQIAKEEAPFDPARAREIFEVYRALAEKSPALYPPGSNTGDTAASPRVWEDNAAFVARFAAFGELAQQGLAAQDLDGFKLAFAAIGKECGACHQTFRVKK